ncbi:aldose 1-epimerase family protein [Companilactobacillus baiquanensis]|uniref:Aldose 1-epimerase family protein n=1 Tax=Companilactobacillus baiquanensis TaxID=2486005 RepID=A0ABW1UYI6_9LACO|nr:aldose 1-epimerase family protein [Companilactobacillus baiquanensis]
MTNTIHLTHKLFNDTPFKILENDNFSAESFVYPSGVEGLKISNSRGYLILLPYMGMIIWDAIFDGESLKMKDMFSQPMPGEGIADTYGCFQFSSGLLANGTPGPEDNYQLHGEFPTSKMSDAYIEFDEDRIKVGSIFEYVKGFGHHYLAKPSVVLNKNSGLFDIKMSVTNLSKYQKMPLQYMCHMNYAYGANAEIGQSIPDNAFKLRESIPDHVHPTEEWLKYNEELKASGKIINKLDDATRYDPEIVFFTDDLSKYSDTAEFRMKLENGKNFMTKINTAEFPIVTRWILYNADQQVAAFALPGTSRPEGYHAAEKAGTLIFLDPLEKREFSVTTGLEN